VEISSSSGGKGKRLRTFVRKKALATLTSPKKGEEKEEGQHACIKLSTRGEKKEGREKNQTGKEKKKPSFCLLLQWGRKSRSPHLSNQEGKKGRKSKRRVIYFSLNRKKGSK